MRYSCIVDIAIKQLSTSIAALTAETKRLPKGRLLMRKRGTRYNYFRQWGNKTTGITKQKDLVLKLFRKRYATHQLGYYQEILLAFEKLAKHLKLIEQKYSDKLLVSKERIDLSGINYFSFLWPERIASWATDEYEGNPRYPEQLRYASISGTVVRSKSEKIIADCLDELGIPYRYEDSYIANGVVYRPDFTIYRTDGSIVIWEHFGRMDLDSYVENCIARLRDYSQRGFSPARNLIITFESDITGRSNVIEIIMKYWY